MKNLKSKIKEDDGKKLLTRAEMKNVVGGDDCGNCAGNGPCRFPDICIMGPDGPMCI